VVLGLFVHWSLVLVRPFLPILLWAVILAVALAPVHRSMSARLGSRPAIAAIALTVVALALVIGPVATLVDNFIETAQTLAGQAETGRLALPEPPPRLVSVPVVGEALTEAWRLAATNLDATLDRYHDVLAPLGFRMLTFLSSVSVDFAQFVVAVILAGVLLVRGETLVSSGRLLARRLIPPRGGHFIDLAGATVRNVSRGVVGIALLQSLLIGIVLEVAGVPGAGMLAFVILILCLVQIGPVLIVLPVIAWAWLTMETAPAAVVTVLLVPMAVMDNVLKPLLMGRGLSTPTIVIFLGVIGGTLSYGLIGLFLGPIVLGVFYDLLVTWVVPRGSEGDSET
jgi:predicted PurR-regulated permease PerM